MIKIFKINQSIFCWTRYLLVCLKNTCSHTATYHHFQNRLFYNFKSDGGHAATLLVYFIFWGAQDKYQTRDCLTAARRLPVGYIAALVGYVAPLLWATLPPLWATSPPMWATCHPKWATSPPYFATC